MTSTGQFIALIGSVENKLGPPVSPLQAVYACSKTPASSSRLRCLPLLVVTALAMKIQEWVIGILKFSLFTF